jgi:hypothetical protein
MGNVSVSSLSTIISQLESFSKGIQSSKKKKSEFDSALNALRDLEKISQSGDSQLKVPKSNIPEGSIASRRVTRKRAGGSGGPTNVSPDAPWQFACRDLEGEMEDHRANGNCLFYALYESCNGNEAFGAKEGSQVTACNLRRLIVEEQLKDLRGRGKELNIDYNRLLRVVEEVNPSGNTQGLGANKVLELWDNIQKRYNENLPNERQLDWNWICGIGKGIIELANTIVATSKDKSWVHNDSMGYVAKILKRPILLIHEGSAVRSTNLGEIGSVTLYEEGIDGEIYNFNKDSGKIYRGGVQRAPNGVDEVDVVMDADEFPEKTIVIAMHNGHYYGVPSFERQGLHVRNSQGQMAKVIHPSQIGIKITGEDSQIPPLAWADSDDGEVRQFEDVGSREARSISNEDFGDGDGDLGDLNRRIGNIPAFRELQRKYRIYHASPTTDHVYKRVFGSDMEIGKSFCDCLLKLGFSDENLSTRSVTLEPESVDAGFKNFYLAVKKFVGEQLPDAQSLKVDALYGADMEDARRPRPNTRDGRVKIPAFILAEMQVEKQDMAVRLLSYACKIMAGADVDVKKNTIPPPVYAFGLCMRRSNSLIKQERISSSNVDERPDKFTELSIGNIFLGNVLPYTTQADAVRTERNNLKQKVVQVFRPNATVDTKSLEKEFKKLDGSEKEVYLWLEFIAFAHLMTPKDVTTSLLCLPVNKRKIFENAYKLIELKDITMKQIKNENPDLFRLVREAEAKKIEQEKQEKIELVASGLFGVRQIADAVKVIKSNQFDVLNKTEKTQVITSLRERQTEAGSQDSDLKNLIQQLDNSSKSKSRSAKKGSQSLKER